MKQNKTFYIRAVLVVLILLWCSLIFFMSGENAEISGDRSEGLSRKIIDFVISLFNLEGDGKEAAVQFFEYVLRKAAHMFSYFILCVLSLLFAFTFKARELSRIFFSSVFCLIYAQSDEIHQIFVPGRAGTLTDVMIDMIGVFVAVIFVYLIKGISDYLKAKKTLDCSNE